MLARFPRRPSLTLIGVVALVIAMANPAAAPPGDLDTTFDGDGKVTTDFAGNPDNAFAVALQGDGKIVAAGETLVSGTTDFALARYNTDGSLDTTFGGDGKVTTDFAAGGDSASAVAIQGDGKIVAAGFAIVSGNNDFALARYNTDGSLDTTFGGDLPFPVPGDGKVTTDFAGSQDLAHGVAIRADGKIVAAGQARVSGSDDFALARYNTDGSLDTTFGGDGKVTTDFAGGSDLAHGVAIQADGKIVAAGEALVSGTLDFALARYNTDGSLDTTFDGDGKVTTDFAGDFDVALAVAIQGDGKIVAAGGAVVAGFDFALARYNTDGSLDPAFGGDGKVTTDFGGFDDAFAVAIQGDGKIVAAGSATVSATADFALARYKTDGSLDTIFSGDGKVTTDFAGSSDQASAVAIQANGRIVAAGGTFISGNFDFALARYTCIRRTSRPTSIPVCP
ncbi:MAG TPA: delta-60 repeat domain-containing protein [Actinomycetota bacterium]|nr:delta-60 repeat domain-containing protein [Actinomycetota bacterium]